MSRLLVAVTVVASLPAFADTVQCLKVREVRELARLRDLDDTAFRTLEDLYCEGRPQPGHRDFGDCYELTVMQHLARMGGSDAAQLGTIDDSRNVACSLGSSTGSSRWSNGHTQKTSSDSWYFPNGLTARSGSGTRSYSNGLTARTTAGTWSYPNGLTARSSSGRWYAPNGLQSDPRELVRRSCANLPGTCQAWLAQLEQATGEMKDLLLLSLAWEAR